MLKCSNNTEPTLQQLIVSFCLNLFYSLTPEMLLLLHSEEKKYITDEADFKEDYFRPKLDVCSKSCLPHIKRRKGENYDFFFFFY